MVDVFRGQGDFMGAERLSGFVLYGQAILSRDYVNWLIIATFGIVTRVLE